MLKSIQLTDVLFTLPPDDACGSASKILAPWLVDWRAGGAAPGDVRKGSSQGSPGFMLPWLCVGKDPYFIFKSQRVTLGEFDSLSSASRRSSRRKTEKSPSYPGVARDFFWSNEKALVMCCILPGHTGELQLWRVYIGIVRGYYSYRGLFYPVLWGLFHKPWNKDFNWATRIQWKVKVFFRRNLFEDGSYKKWNLGLLGLCFEDGSSILLKMGCPNIPGFVGIIHKTIHRIKELKIPGLPTYNLRVATAPLFTVAGIIYSNFFMAGQPTPPTPPEIRPYDQGFLTIGFPQ